MPLLRCYDPSGDGSGGIHEWFAQQSDEARAAIEITLAFLEQEKSVQGLEHVVELHGACEGLSEIIIEVEVPDEAPHRRPKRKRGKRRGRSEPREPEKLVQHYRILGFEGPERSEFTLLFGFQKTARGSRDYAAACHSALMRKEGVLRNGRRAPACEF